MQQEESDHPEREIWLAIAADMERARRALPTDSSSDVAVVAYLHYLEHNELELACDELESYSERHAVPREFWSALCDAAVKMALYQRASRYKSMAAAA